YCSSGNVAVWQNCSGGIVAVQQYCSGSIVAVQQYCSGGTVATENGIKTSIFSTNMIPGWNHLNGLEDSQADLCKIGQCTCKEEDDVKNFSKMEGFSNLPRLLHKRNSQFSKLSKMESLHEKMVYNVPLK
ncbi:hypothetical protein KI387_010093, partial [Taxus chinensis]